MKKFLILFLFFGLISSSVLAQTTMMQRRMLPGKIDTLLINYFSYSKLSSLDDIGYSDAIANQFRFLFTSNAKITDEVNPSYYDKNYDHPFDLPIRTLDDYLAKTKENYPAGLFVKFNALQVDYNTLSILMLKETNGTTKTGLLYKVTDTLKLRLDLSSDGKTLKIQDVSVIGYTIALANDNDRDFIPNELDKCPNEQGFRTATGCFTKEEKAAFALAEKDKKQKEKENKNVVVNDKEKEAAALAEKERLRKEKEDKAALARKEKEDKNAVAQKEKEDKSKTKPATPDLPGFFIGLSFAGGNNKISSAFNENNIAYTNLIKGSKSVYGISNIKQKKQAPSLQVQLDLDYFFGKKKNIGIATGIGYTMFNASFGMDSFHVEYQATDSKGHVYRRIVHAYDMKENLKISSINIPFLLQYKFGAASKSNFCLGIGINYHHLSSAKVKATATADVATVVLPKESWTETT